MPMRTHAIVYRPLASHPYKVVTKHARFYLTRLQFTRAILATSYHVCLVTPTGFYCRVLGIQGNQTLHIPQVWYTPSAAGEFDLRAPYPVKLSLRV